MTKAITIPNSFSNSQMDAILNTGSFIDEPTAPKPGTDQPGKPLYESIYVMPGGATEPVSEGTLTPDIYTPETITDDPGVRPDDTPTNSKNKKLVLWVGGSLLLLALFGSDKK